MSQTASNLQVDSVTMKFGAYTAVDDVSLDVKGGEFLGLLGPSGCGKTTLLRMIAGFLRPSSGRIICDKKDITPLPPYVRRFGVVFQNYALFPHMTAAQNVGYGLKVARVSRAEIDERVLKALAKVGLSNAGDRYPSQLSGGMQQRVALARALVIEPPILLLDEPLSALDKNLREEMQVELRLLQQNVGVTTIFVTHDQEEAMTLSDRIAVMNDGRILQLGAPDEVYLHPKSRFVATFLGTTNIIPASVRKMGQERAEISIEGANFCLPCTGHKANGSDITVAVRPENLRITDEPNGVPGTVKDILFQGHRLIVIFDTNGGRELRSFASPAGWTLPKGAPAYATWSDADARILEQ